MFANIIITNVFHHFNGRGWRPRQPEGSNVIGEFHVNGYVKSLINIVGTGVLDGQKTVNLIFLYVLDSRGRLSLQYWFSPASKVFG